MSEPEDPVASARRLLAAGEAHHAELLAISPRLLAALCERLEEAEREVEELGALRCFKCGGVHK